MMDLDSYNLNKITLSNDKLVNIRKKIKLQLDDEIFLENINNDFNNLYLNNLTKNINYTEQIPNAKTNIEPDYNFIYNAYVETNLDLKDAELFNELECTCCYDSKEINNITQCDGGHFICKDCVKRHSENMIYQNICTNIKCINTQENCFHQINEKVLSNVLDAKVFNEYVRLKNSEEVKKILSLNGLNMIQCGFCDEYYDMDIKQDNLYCVSCTNTTCLLCGQKSHEGKPCEKERLNIEDKLTKEILLSCTRCKKSIFKEDGCNKITCPCGNLMCWICKSNINEQGYNHFCNGCGTTGKKTNPNCNKCHTWDDGDKERLINAVKNEYANNKQYIDKLL